MNKINSVSKDESTNYSLMNKNEIVATFTLEIKSGLVRITNVHALRLYCLKHADFYINDAERQDFRKSVLQKTYISEQKKYILMQTVIFFGHKKVLAVNARLFPKK